MLVRWLASTSIWNLVQIVARLVVGFALRRRSRFEGSNLYASSLGRWEAAPGFNNRPQGASLPDSSFPLPRPKTLDFRQIPDRLHRPGNLSLVGAVK
ncbi:hypothetical protein F5883DRAFT_180589 [Diaporthe sp. PMI_573]|nr:hypothetical protein F5883DRAFT_180589 [Diaporthaceae sp. PMI_573]